MRGNRRYRLLTVLIGMILVCATWILLQSYCGVANAKRFLTCDRIEQITVASKRAQDIARMYHGQELVFSTDEKFLNADTLRVRGDDSAIVQVMRTVGARFCIARDGLKPVVWGFPGYPMRYARMLYCDDKGLRGEYKAGDYLQVSPRLYLERSCVMEDSHVIVVYLLPLIWILYMSLGRILIRQGNANGSMNNVRNGVIEIMIHNIVPIVVVTLNVLLTLIALIFVPYVLMSMYFIYL